MNKEEVLKKLDEMGITYKVDHHEAVFTVEAMVKLGLDKQGEIIKNLFLRDGSGKHHFLVLMCEEKQADLKAIAAQIGSSRLSFASEDRLMKYLQVSRGSVSPLCLLNDPDHNVTAVIDRDLENRKSVGVHPNDNTATVWLSFSDLKKVIDSCGHTIKYIRI